MKHKALPFSSTSSIRFGLSRTAIALGAALSLCAQSSAWAAPLFADDFNDGNDNGWNHYDPIAAAVGGGTFVHYSFPNGGYRIVADPSPLPAVAGPGRGAGLRSEIYTNFYIAVDVVGWDDSLVQAFGPLARVTNPGPGSTLGYAFTYQCAEHTISIAKITNEEGNDLSGTSKAANLDPAKRYRFVFIGKGSALEGRVYELPDTRNPIAITTAGDATYTTGITGLLVYNNPPPGTGGGDATFDNYFSLDVEPPVLTITPNAFGDLEITWPIEVEGFQLQSANAIPSSNWETIPGDFITTRPGSYVYTATPEPTNAFFRLVRP